MIRSNPEHFERGATPGDTRRMTADDSAIVNDLGHVAFMAWLIEARDERDITVMREQWPTVGGHSHVSNACRGLSHAEYSAILLEVVQRR